MTLMMTSIKFRPAGSFDLARSFEVANACSQASLTPGPEDSVFTCEVHARRRDVRPAACRAGCKIARLQAKVPDSSPRYFSEHHSSSFGLRRIVFPLQGVRQEQGGDKHEAIFPSLILDCVLYSTANQDPYRLPT